jgi:hypothetical protein
MSDKVQVVDKENQNPNTMETDEKKLLTVESEYKYLKNYIQFSTFTNLVTSFKSHQRTSTSTWSSTW